MTAKHMFYPETKTFSDSDEKQFAREDFVYNVTEDILVALENLNLSKQDLAKKLGRSKSHITQLLSGGRNMTLGSLSDICFVLNIKPKINLSYSARAIPQGTSNVLDRVAEEAAPRPSLKSASSPRQR